MTGRQGPFWEELAEINPDVVILDGPGDRYLFDPCIVGVATRLGMDPVLVYDEQKMVDTLAAASGISEEEASELLWTTTLDVWYGTGTPLILWMVDMSKQSADRPTRLVDILTEEASSNGHG